MLLSPKEYDRAKIFDNEQQLLEKLIMYSQGKKYGQIVFVVGGAGSGKGFAISNFMEKEKFRVRDVDEWKRIFIALDKLGRVRTGAGSLKLTKSQDVGKMHLIIKDLNIKEKTLMAILMNAKNKAALPNILFDMTGKDIAEITKVIPELEAVGYQAKNIHVTWVLTKYSVAIERNLSPGRGRVVPTDVMLRTHVGAATTMSQIIKGKIPRSINGGVYVVLNNQENTVPFVRDGKPIKNPKTGGIIVKDFTYVTLKKEGKRFFKEKEIQKQLYHWISSNVPAEALKVIPEPEL